MGGKERTVRVIVCADEEKGQTCINKQTLIDHQGLYKSRGG